ncbi:hypothetical protein [Leptothoe sp. PORK10 BA2]|uniref:hypothetical protein n=1 Tax=Leptothoe sp. PORK10 BA2 TaxID=3110254 RepID=UPI002B1F70F2|nr:hypothetical protein [Leptothoe sp. PORK10 BA2]MEA5464631.1 hypothetical protein [Leptothoe sp. PORK10 BA2]
MSSANNNRPRRSDVEYGGVGGWVRLLVVLCGLRFWRLRSGCDRKIRTTGFE